MKVTAAKLSVFFMLATVAGLAGWILLLAYDVRQDTWTAWNNAIDVVWTIIPLSLLGAIVCGIVAMSKPARRVTGIIVLILALCFTAYIIYMLTHLGIR